VPKTGINNTKALLIFDEIQNGKRVYRYLLSPLIIPRYCNLKVLSFHFAIDISQEHEREKGFEER